MTAPLRAASRSRRPPAHALPARERLLATASQLFSRRGYAATSVREIAAGAGVTKPNLYHHFGSKEGIFLELIGRLEREMEERLEAVRREPGTPLERIRAICQSLYSIVNGREPEVRLLYAIYYGPAQGAPEVDIEALPNRVEAALAQAVREGMACGEIRQGDVRDTTLALQGSLVIAIECHIAERQPSFGPEGLDRLLDVILRGVAAPARTPHPRASKEPSR
ncbi:MAG TPA: TetR/AcrR family transcriptional regulator [Thermoanaerobaculia bacterium]|nr:TetR/AcrR family transcriptional regulator [Thermoanaerobaculia bacterium]